MLRFLLDFDSRKRDFRRVRPLRPDSKSDTLTVNVPATSNPYLAGLPNGTTARVGDSAPQQSPVLVQRTLSHAVAVTFTAVGAIQHTPECPPDCHGPNGAELTRHLEGAEHGIADILRQWTR